MGPLTVCERVLHAVDEQRGHQAREEAARADGHRIEVGNGVAHRRQDVRVGLQPHVAHFMPARVTSIDLDFAAMDGAVRVFGAQHGLLDTDRPDIALTPQQRAQTTDGGKKVAGVLLHHRQQQVAAGVAAQPRVLEGRQPRQQHPPRLAFVARQRERAPQDVAWWQHAQLIAQLARAAAAVEHGDHRVQRQPRVAFQATQQAGETGSAAETANLELAQAHGGNSIVPQVPQVPGASGAAGAAGTYEWIHAQRQRASLQPVIDDLRQHLSRSARRPSWPTVASHGSRAEPGAGAAR